MARIGLDDKDLPKSKDFIPDAKYRRSLIKKYNKSNPTSRITMPLPMVMLLFYIGLVGFFIALTVYSVFNEGDSYFQIILFLVVPLTIVWLIALFLDIFFAMQIAAVGFLIWGGVFLTVGSDSSMALMLTAGWTALYLFATDI